MLPHFGQNSMRSPKLIIALGVGTPYKAIV
jgi:hypothetical protein